MDKVHIAPYPQLLHRMDAGDLLCVDVVYGHDTNGVYAEHHGHAFTVVLERTSEYILFTPLSQDLLSIKICVGSKYTFGDTLRLHKDTLPIVYVELDKPATLLSGACEFVSQLFLGNLTPLSTVAN